MDFGYYFQNANKKYSYLDMDPKILDRQIVIEHVKQLVPLMKKASHPEEELLHFAREHDMSPEMLGAVAKAINTLKTQSIYASSKTASDRGRSFSTIDTESLLKKYAEVSMPNVLSMHKFLEDSIHNGDDQFFEFDVEDMRKAASDNSSHMAEGDFTVLYEDEYKPNPISEAEIVQYNNLVDGEYTQKIASSTVADWEFETQDYLDLEEELRYNLSSIEKKFAKFFNPQNLLRDKEFFEIVQDTRDLFDIQSTTFDDAAVKLASVLSDSYGLGEYILTEQLPNTWGERHKIASFLAPDEPYDLANSLLDYFTNFSNLGVVASALQQKFASASSQGGSEDGANHKDDKLTDSNEPGGLTRDNLADIWLAQNGYLVLEDGQYSFDLPEVGDSDWNEFVKEVPDYVVEHIQDKNPAYYINEIYQSKKDLEQNRDTSGSQDIEPNDPNIPDDDVDPNIHNGDSDDTNTSDENSENTENSPEEFYLPAVSDDSRSLVHEPHSTDLIKGDQMQTLPSFNNWTIDRFTTPPPPTPPPPPNPDTGSPGDPKKNPNPSPKKHPPKKPSPRRAPMGSPLPKLPPFDAGKALGVASDIAKSPYKFLYKEWSSSKPTVNPTEGKLIDEINKVKSSEFFNDLMITDPVLSKLNFNQKRELADMLQAAKDFMPDITKNKTVLKTFLRQGAELGGMDLNTVKLLDSISKNKQG